MNGHKVNIFENIFFNFLITLSNKFERIDYTQFNWLVYHFMIYLQSEVMSHIINDTKNWEPKPFFFKIESLSKEKQVQITVKYNAI